MRDGERERESEWTVKGLCPNNIITVVSIETPDPVLWPLITCISPKTRANCVTGVEGQVTLKLAIR